MTPTHHTPPSPNAVRSIVAPHMGCLGDYRDMLSQDVALAASILRGYEADLEDAILSWQHSTGPARHTHRRVARHCIAVVERWRGEYEAAFWRLRLHGVRAAA